MSYTPTAVEVAFWQTLAPLVPAGVQMIYANQGGPRPSSLTYATILVIGDQAIGLRTVEMSAEPGVAADTYLLYTGQQRVVQISVQAFGPNAYAAISRLTALYESPIVAYDAFVRGVSLTACGEATRIPAELLTETEDRWTVTLTGAYHRADALETAALETAVASLLVDEDPQPVAVVTVTFP